MRLKIGTYNIAHGRGTAKSNWSGGSKHQRLARLAAIANVIKDLDIVILNEVDFMAPWTLWSQNQAKILQELGGFNPPETAMNNRIIWHCGIAILSKYPVFHREVIRLPQYYKWWTSFGYRKDALAIRVELPDGRQIKVIGVHLTHQSDAGQIRRESAKTLLDYTKKQSVPVVIAGDYNTQPSGFPGDRDVAPTAIDLLRQNDLFQTKQIVHPLEEEMTFHSLNPMYTIDWIFVPKDWRIVTYKALPVKFSDHRPVVAEFKTE